jgi:hypothetical protein
MNQKPSNAHRQLQMIISFDSPNEIQRSLVCWKGLAEVFLSTPLTPNSTIQPKNEIHETPTILLFSKLS